MLFQSWVGKGTLRSELDALWHLNTYEIDEKPTFNRSLQAPVSGEDDGRHGTDRVLLRTYNGPSLSLALDWALWLGTATAGQARAA